MTVETEKKPRRLDLRSGDWSRRLAVAVTLGLVLSGCASQTAYLSDGEARLGRQPYAVGPLTVLIRPQSEVELICRLRSPDVAPLNVRVHGCYVPGDSLIVSTADPYVLMHEFKHHFEGGWHQ